MLAHLFPRQSQAGSRRSTTSSFQRFFDRFQPDGPPAAPATEAEIQRCEQRLGSPLPPSLAAFLMVRNGGHFGGGLIHVSGACRPLRHDDLATWNQRHDWKSAFPGYELQAYVFFADDVFGNLFGYETGLVDPPVLRFDVQFGEFTEMAPSITAFFEELLVEEGSWLLGGDYLQAYRETGASWQVGRHLSQVVPSLLGGSMDPDNLCPMDPPTNLFLAGQVLTQVKPLPPGTEVRGFRFDPQTLTLRFETIRTR